ncbi:hypothetical protein [Rachiplusia nu nucleopolyhedrovirus]|uniref:Uncharacterized protein n=1 Tax=Rachiplusia nu nucleopolyhedrovirus TaxID=2605775 RepID=A0AAE6M6D0_9ABAC|nr:hypothetical protein QKQ55_gp031 [Rachiplusia nu nucleopolyhedrovirus]QEI03653.1 hypothetical protein [Rachiplusia nu nucleopolyhedrovirus]
MDFPTFCLAADSLRYELRCIDTKVLLVQRDYDFKEDKEDDIAFLKLSLKILQKKLFYMMSVLRNPITDPAANVQEMNKYFSKKIKDELAFMLKNTYPSHKNFRQNYPLLQYSSWLIKTNFALSNKERFLKYMTMHNMTRFETFMEMGYIYSGRLATAALMEFIQADYSLSMLIMERLNIFSSAKDTLS